MAFLEKSVFTTVIDSTPLVSIDLVIENTDGKILLGYRNNRPAKGYWFVPGGRIQKGESMDDAFQRLTLAEIGKVFQRENATFLGPYEHFYDDYVFGEDVLLIMSFWVISLFAILIFRRYQAPSTMSTNGLIKVKCLRIHMCTCTASGILIRLFSSTKSNT